MTSCKHNSSIEPPKLKQNAIPMTDLTPPSPGGCSERGVIRIGVVLAAFQCSKGVSILESFAIQWFSVHH